MPHDGIGLKEELKEDFQLNLAIRLFMDEYKHVPKKGVKLVLLGCLTAFLLFIGLGAYYVYGIYTRLELEGIKAGALKPSISGDIRVETKSYDRLGLHIPIIGIEPSNSSWE